MSSAKRLHPVTILDTMIKNFKILIEILVPGIIVLSKFKQWLIPGLILLVVLFVGYAILDWFRYVYWVENNELRVEHGILVRQKIHIPRERIQTIQTSAGVVQRIFGLVKLEVETAGGGAKAEVTLAALTSEQAQSLHQALQGGNINIPQEAKGQQLEYHLSTKSLLAAASTSNGIGVTLLFFSGLLSQVDQFLPDLHVYQLIGKTAESWLGSSTATIIVGCILVAILAWLFSVIGTLIKLGGFTLERDGNELRITRGLLDKRQVIIPLKRIQAITVKEGILRQPFGLASLEVVTAGYAGKGGEGNMLFPLLHRSKVEGFLAEAVPGYATSLAVDKLPVKARIRYCLVPGFSSLIILVPVSLWVPYGEWALLFLPLMLWLGYKQFKAAGIRLTGDKLVVRTRILGMKTSIVPKKRVQMMCLDISVFQARRHLCNLAVKTASGVGGSSFGVKGLEQQRARQIIEQLSPGLKAARGINAS